MLLFGGSAARRPASDVPRAPTGRYPMTVRPDGRSERLQDLSENAGRIVHPAHVLAICTALSLRTQALVDWCTILACLLLSQATHSVPSSWWGTVANLSLLQPFTKGRASVLVVAARSSLLT